MDYVLRTDLMEYSEVYSLFSDEYYNDHSEIVCNKFGYNDAYDKYEVS